MAEEHAWLVRAHSDSESFGSLSSTMHQTHIALNAPEGAKDPNTDSHIVTTPQQDTHTDRDESGDLIDYTDAAALEQFHEDALRQAGCGLAQVRVLLAGGLAVGGSSLELSAIPFVLPSAEIELCILPHEKNWLVLISLLGCSLGSVGWGSLSGRVGRRRALLSALAVNAVFASIAAFMPTYGTFMMARFCSAIGSGGIVPICFTYSGEMFSRTSRPRALAILLGAIGAGVLLAAGLARAILPQTGADALIEDKEHFSAWHRYLLLCTLPILASLVSLIWTQESPRCLLDLGREVDAMMTYQSIQTSNQTRVCGGKGVVEPPRTDAEYRLGELALPGKRRPPALHHVRHSVKLFWQAFFQLFSGTYRRTTLYLGGVLLFTFVIQCYLSAYVPAAVDRRDNESFEASKRTVFNMTLKNKHYNETIENVEYEEVTFVNCTFRDMLMSHVQFVNCTFLDVAFSNIKSSYMEFKASLFVNSTIIDTDIEVGREIDDQCVLNGTVVRGIQEACGRQAELRSQLAGLTDEQVYSAHATLFAALAATLLPLILQYDSFLCGACILLSSGVYAATGELTLYLVEAAFRLLLSLIFLSVSVQAVNAYPAGLRCTVHGLILSVAYMGGVITRGCGVANELGSGILVSFMATAATLASRAR